MEEQWFWVTGAVVLGLVGLVAGAKKVLTYVAPRTASTVDDDLLVRLNTAESLLRAIAVGMGVEVSNKDTAVEVRDKIVAAKARDQKK